MTANFYILVFKQLVRYTFKGVVIAWSRILKKSHQEPLWLMFTETVPITVPKFKSRPDFSFRSFPIYLGSLSNDDGDGQRNRQKATGLLCKTTLLHMQPRSFKHFFGSTLKCLIASFMEDVSKRRRLILFF